jgi:hypothetical protein
VARVTRQFGATFGGRLLILAPALLIALIVAACEEQLQPTTARIHGRLTLDGHPLAPGHSVVFMEPLRGDLAFGVTDVDGRFHVNSWRDGEMVPGRYKVYVTPPMKVDPDGTPRAERNDETEETRLSYPEIYRQLETTPLEYNITVGENDVQVELKSPQ